MTKYPENKSIQNGFLKNARKSNMKMDFVKRIAMHVGKSNFTQGTSESLFAPRLPFTLEINPLLPTCDGLDGDQSN